MNKTPVNILMVDDQPAKLLSYEAILGPLGENLIKASSGTEALEKLLRTDIAVVLIDVHMPDLDGFELAQMIHQHPRHQRAALIFVSAVHMTDIDRLRGYEVGGVDYVSVPIVPEILRARVSVFADLYRKTQELEQLNEELERRVSERTSALEASTERLRESEDALRETDRRKDEFLAMLAHELRNPLAPIRNSVEYLRMRAEEDPSVRWSHDVIDRQIDHLTRLVDDLLDVSRITRGRLEIRRERSDLGEILRGAVDTIQAPIQERGQTLHVSLPPEPIWVDADVVRMTQIFLNLLDNASKFTPAGGAIWLRSERAGGDAVVRLKDTGAGITAEELPQLFQMFYQIRRSSTGSQGGLGIGLALVRRLVELHGGSVEASSEGHEQGAEFVVRLPALADVAPAEANGTPQAEVALPATRRVLVVDDNVDSAESLAMLLRLGGHEIETAYDGFQAVAAAERFLPDLILLDIGLPGMDGYEVAARLREGSAGRELVLIAVTGWGQEEDRRRSREAGFDAHLTKPVDMAALTRLVADLPKVAV
ncbi:MAG TPA: response regulator [Candidatus Eisenbacteria bacterium]|nr:response regulator [Candidatus Eisenbacteria bacterium]